MTLTLAALDLIRLPVAAVEASIALSIVFVASEFARGRRETVTWRYPISVSATFGLLHGFGFAGVLAEIGLPQTQVLAALLFFNVGVEIGQILFVCLLMALYFVMRPLFVRMLESGANTGVHWTSVTTPDSYFIGTIASYWVIERVAGFWA